MLALKRAVWSQSFEQFTLLIIRRKLLSIAFGDICMFWVQAWSSCWSWWSRWEIHKNRGKTTGLKYSLWLCDVSPRIILLFFRWTSHFIFQKNPQVFSDLSGNKKDKIHYISPSLHVPIVTLLGLCIQKTCGFSDWVFMFCSALKWKQVTSNFPISLCVLYCFSNRSPFDFQLDMPIVANICIYGYVFVHKTFVFLKIRPIKGRFKNLTEWGLSVIYIFFFENLSSIKHNNDKH